MKQQPLLLKPWGALEKRDKAESSSCLPSDIEGHYSSRWPVGLRWTLRTQAWSWSEGKGHD